MSNIIRHIEEHLEQWDNFIAVYIALISTIEGLQDYVDSIVSTVRIDIYKKLATLPNCLINCSKNVKNGNNWCQTCKAWKRELETYVNGHPTYRVQWSSMNSIDWLYSNEDVSKCFIKSPGHVGHTISGFGVVKDIGNLMSLLEHLNICDIDTDKLKAVAQIRNTRFGHNYSAQILRWEKQECIDILLDILTFPSVCCHESAKSQICFLRQLRESNTALESLNNRPNLQIPISEARQLEKATQLTDSSRLQFHEKLQRFTQPFECEKDNIIVYRNQSLRFLKCVFDLSVLLLLLVVVIYGIRNNSDKENGEECLCLEHGKTCNFWKLVLSHVKAIYSESTVQRSWIVGRIETALNSSDVGVIMTAETGYGKSTIASHIICGRITLPWSNLHKHLISYHICRTGHDLYNDPSTFITNLAGMIIRHVPSIGSLIHYDEIATEFLESETLCKEDPFTCIEALVINPLSKSSYNKTLLIVIDAIDECTLQTKRKNVFLNILAKYIKHFPPYVKFVVTSRNLVVVQTKLGFLKHIHMDTTEEHNTRDIHQYVEDNSDMSKQEVVKFVGGVRENFLFAKAYLHHCIQMSSCISQSVPESVLDLYENTLDRAFGEDYGAFIKMLPLFEVIIATYKPLNLYELIDILNLDTSTEEYFILDTIGNELRHFIRKSELELSIIHKSFADFLTNASRKGLRYYVSKANGHKRLSEYLLQKLNRLKPVDLVELVYHVSLSKNKHIEQRLFHNKHNIQKLVLLSDEGWMHKAAREVNSYETIKIIYDLIGKNEIYLTNTRNFTAPFIAALNGNDESLKAFLSIGINISQKIEVIHHSLYTFNSKFLVYICKYYFFCGYSMLHIASQNGHLDVVELIIKKQRSLIYQTNDMNLKPIHLAAESGFSGVFEILYNFDKKQGDALSLHHAAEQGNYKIVNLLLRGGLRDECLPCNGSLYWISQDANRIQSNKDIISNILSLFMKDFKNETFRNYFGKTKLYREFLKGYNSNKNFKSLDEITNQDNIFDWLRSFSFTQFCDDWHLLTCETALHAAVRNRHLKVIKQLLAKSITGLNCMDVTGKTPLMSAIAYGNSEIFKYLYEFEKIMSWRCMSKIQFASNDIIKISDYDMFILQNIQCHVNTTFYHLFAAHGSNEMLKLVLNNTNITWAERDSDNAVPLHYAFCHNNKYFIDIAFTEAIYNETLYYRTSNGSTPFHSAASCESHALSYIFEAYRQRTPDVKDFSGRSILHIAIIGHKPSQNHKSWYSFNLYALVDKMNHNITHQDNNGQNVFHHACTAGTYYVINHAKQVLSRNDILGMMLQNDTNGFTPIETAFNAMTKRLVMEPIIIPTNCSLGEMFTYKCGLNYSHLLSPHELCILSISQFLSENNKFDKIDIWKLVHLSATKSRLFPILMMKEYARSQFNNILLSFSNIEKLVHSYQGPYLEEFVLTKDNALRCNSSHHSPLHTLLMNERNRYWYHSTTEFFDLFIKPYSSHFLDCCFDTDGLNLFHRAAMGGHLKALHYLLSKGLDVNKLSLRNQSALDILVRSSPFLLNGIAPYYFDDGLMFYIIRYQTQVRYKDHIEPKLPVKFDESATLLLKFTDLSKVKLCLNQQEDLSLLHITSAKGFLKFLKQVKYMYGEKIMDCRNKHDLTPLFFAKLMNQTIISRWLIQTGINIVQPTSSAYEHTLLNLVNNFHIFDWTCQITYPDHYSVYAYHNMIKCIKTIMSHDDFITVDKRYDQFRTLKLEILKQASYLWISDVNDRAELNLKKPNFTEIVELCEGACNLSKTDVMTNDDDDSLDDYFMYNYLVEKHNEQIYELKKQCDQCLHILSQSIILFNLHHKKRNAIRNWMTKLFRNYAIFGFADKKYLLYMLSKNNMFKNRIQMINSGNDLFFTSYTNRFSYLRVLSMLNVFHREWMSTIISKQLNASVFFAFEKEDTRRAIKLIPRRNRFHWRK